MLKWQDKTQESVNSANKSENIGYRIMKCNNQYEGQGLGKQSDGIKEPIELPMKNNRLGLGNKHILVFFYSFCINDLSTIFCLIFYNFQYIHFFVQINNIYSIFIYINFINRKYWQ